MTSLWLQPTLRIAATTTPIPQPPKTQLSRARSSPFLLDEYPSKLTIPELSLAMNRDPDDFAENDAIERAVRELVGAGLLHHHGTFVLPTRAALYREALVMD